MGDRTTTSSKSTTTTVSSNPSRTITAYLLLDIEEYHPRLTCREILEKRLEIYGEAKTTLRKRAQNKFYRLLRVKEQNPKEYNRHLSQSLKLFTREEEEQEEDDFSIESPPVSSANMSVDHHKKRKGIPLNVLMSPPRGVGGGASVNSSTSRGAGDLYFEDESEAITFGKYTAGLLLNNIFIMALLNYLLTSTFDLLFAPAPDITVVFDDLTATRTIHVNLSEPEKNGGDFQVHHLTGIKTPDKSEKIEQLLIQYNHLPDLRDFNVVAGHVVLQGRGFMVTLPSIPCFFVESHEALTAKESKDPDGAIGDARAKLATIMATSVARTTQSILFLFPEGTICSSDMNHDSPTLVEATGKMKTRVAIREIRHEYEVQDPKTNAMVKQYQIFHPAHWKLRIVSAERVLLKPKANQVQDNLLSAFSEGMSMN